MITFCSSHCPFGTHIGHNYLWAVCGIGVSTPDWLPFGLHFSCTKLRWSDQLHNLESPDFKLDVGRAHQKFPGAAGFHRGRHHDKFSSLIRIGLRESWWRSDKKYAFSWKTWIQNLGVMLDKPLIVSNASKTRVYCFASVMLTGWP